MAFSPVQYFPIHTCFFNGIHGKEEYHFGKCNRSPFESNHRLYLVTHVVHQMLMDFPIGIIAVAIMSFILQVLVMDINHQELVGRKNFSFV